MMISLNVRTLLLENPHISYLTLPIDEASGTVLFLGSRAGLIAKKIVKDTIPERNIAEFTDGSWRIIPDKEDIDLDDKFINAISNLFLVSYEDDILFYVDYNDEVVLGICKDKTKINFIEKIVGHPLNIYEVLGDFNRLIEGTQGNYKYFAEELKRKSMFDGSQ